MSFLFSEYMIRKTTSILFLIILGIFVFLSACRKTINCPAFDADDSIHFAYNNLDSLVFVSNYDDTLEILFQSVEMSKAYTYSCKDLYGICPCLNSIKVMVKDSRNANSYVLLEMEQSDRSALQSFTYTVLGFEFEFDYINELPYIDEIEHIDYIGNKEIKAVQYTGVVLVKNMDLSPANISAVYINKENGILEFTEKNPLTTWSLVVL